MQPCFDLLKPRRSIRTAAAPGISLTTVYLPGAIEAPQLVNRVISVTPKLPVRDRESTVHIVMSLQISGVELTLQVRPQRGGRTSKVANIRPEYKIDGPLFITASTIRSDGSEKVR